jgi:hypothetical protein
LITFCIAGKIIGKKGSVISNIQRESKAKLINAMTSVSDSLWIAIAIIGEWSCIVNAYNALHDIVEGEVDEVVLEFTINYRRKFFLYGKGIQPAIRLISARTNVRIFFPDFNPKEQSFAEAEPFTLEGRFVDVVKAVALLEQEALKYVEMMKERAAALEAKEKQEKEAKEKRDKLRDAKEKEKDVTVKSKLTPTVILDRKAGPVSGPPAEERGSGVDRTKAKEVPTGKSAIKVASSEQEKKVKDIKKDVSIDQAKPAAKTAASTASTKNTVKPAVSSAPTNVPVAPSTVKSTPPIAPTLSNVASSEPKISSARSTGNSSKPLKGTPAETTEGVSAEDKPSVSVEKGEKVSRLIDIPYNIVGLLLSKKPRVKLSIMNQIQSNTRTFISKVISAPDAGKSSLTQSSGREDRHGKRRRRIDAEEEESSDESDSEEEDEESKNDEAEETDVAAKAIIADADQPPVAFNIVGYSMDNVNAAYGYLERIIKGERIKDVLDSIPKRTREPKPEGRSAPDREKRSTPRERNEKTMPKSREPRSSKTPQPTTIEYEEKGSTKNLSASEPVEKPSERPTRAKPRSASSSLPSSATPPVAPALSDSILPVGEKEKGGRRTENSRAEGLKSAAPEGGEEKSSSAKGGASKTSEKGARSRDHPDRPRGEGRGRGRESNTRESNTRDSDEGREGRGGRGGRGGRTRGPPSRGPPSSEA